MNVRKICTRTPDLVKEGESARQAALRMRSRNVGTLVVTGEGGRPSGIVTDRDLALRVVAAGLDPERTPVGKVMTRELVVVAEDAAPERALALMRRRSVRRLVVVDGEGALAGVLSLDDLLNHLIGEMKSVGGLLKRSSPQAVAAV